ncbi:Major facilitator superfamily protein [Spironucleus salmonicida]|uniref:Major facilitator superfamily protein n=1 Tax=Spironucleus salmonicida TaxID=348837 RepID=V6LSI0_9EUKA|nr:Major facilitator superfamily protein [Spironucleus salmonicida]|eukprot:EST47183.1 Major facilitator superfamily protein [Spironucleus salmonicida]
MNFQRKYLQTLRTSPILTALLIIAPPQIYFLVIQNCFINNSIFIAKYYEVSLNQIQLLQHIDIISICSFTVYFNSFQQVFGVQTLYLFSTWVLCISMILCTIFNSNFLIIIVLRIIQGISSSFLLVGTTPLIRNLIDIQFIPKAITFSVTILSASEIISSLLFPFILQYYGLQYIYLTISSVSIIHTIYVTLLIAQKITYNKLEVTNQHILLFIPLGTTLFISGLTLLNKIQYMLVSLVIIVLGTLSIIVFIQLYQNSSNNLFSIQYFIKKYSFVFIQFLLSVSIAAEFFQYPIIWRQIFQLTIIENGILISINKIINLALAQIISKIVKRYQLKCIILCGSSLLLINQVISVISLKYYCQIWLIEILHILSSLYYLQIQLAIMSHNTLKTQIEHKSIVASCLSYFNKLSLSIGMALSLALQQLAEQIYSKQTEKNNQIGNILHILIFGVQISYSCCIIFSMLGLFFCLNLEK